MCSVNALWDRITDSSDVYTTELQTVVQWQRSLYCFRCCCCCWYSDGLSRKPHWLQPASEAPVI